MFLKLFCVKYVLFVLSMHTKVRILTRENDVVAFEQQRHIPACTSVHSDQRLCYSICGQYNDQACSVLNFNIRVSLSFCRTDWLGSCVVGNFSRRGLNDPSKAITKPSKSSVHPATTQISLCFDQSPGFEVMS